MCDSVPSARYSSVCNVLRQWRIWLIPTLTYSAVSQTQDEDMADYDNNY